MRAVCPIYNNNEEIRYYNKIKIHHFYHKTDKNDVFRIIINDDYGNYK